jgi:hypothetical protein
MRFRYRERHTDVSRVFIFSCLIIHAPSVFVICEFGRLREISCRWSILVLDLIRFHIGIMTHAQRDGAYLASHMNLWGREFLSSRYSDGMHYVSEKAVRDLIVPTAVVNLSHLRNLSWRPRLARGQATKRIASFRYFLRHTRTSFLLFTTDNAFVWVKNLPYLAGQLRMRKLTTRSHFIWGNCMKNSREEFIQGGSGYLLSRRTARLILKIADLWIPTVEHSEDVYFERAMNSVGLSARRSSSEFFIGQYINWGQQEAIESFNFTAIQSCAQGTPKSCRPFFYPYNKIVVLHRLSNHFFSRPPRPVYDFPDNLFWYQRREHAAFCMN